MNPRLGTAAAALTLLLALAGSCTLTRPLHGLTCEQGAGNGSCFYGQPCESGSDCATATCTASLCQCPEEMVTIDSLFCVDPTEVTNAAYRSFLATKPDPSLQEAACQWNTDFGFDQGLVTPSNGCKTRHTEDDHPASCIDWCDAHAFCQSLGKHLCGRLHGGPNPVSASADATLSEWYYACSKHGSLGFSTGSYDPVTCNVDSPGSRAVGNVATSPCEGGYDGLYDLTGNVGEWEDSCTGASGADDTCLVRGGSYDLGGATPDDYRCKAAAGYKRNESYHAIGFRCCSG